jgi:hypothetical protein
MNKKTAGLLIGAGAGAALVWAVRRGLINLFPRQHRYVVLDDDGGTCRVKTKPDELYLVRKQKVTWHITNNCGKDFEVSLTNWKDEQGNRKSPAVDPDGEESGELSRHVPAGETRDINGKARAASVFLETFFYDVYLNGQPAADPIVKLVL